MELNNFINTIGYDGNSAIVDKLSFSENKNKNLKDLLDKGKFHAAAAYAVYNDDENGLQTIADKYNELSGSHYKKDQIKRLFGISKVQTKKTIFL